MPESEWTKLHHVEDLPDVGVEVEVKWLGEGCFRAKLIDYWQADWLLLDHCRTHDVTHWRPKQTVAILKVKD